MTKALERLKQSYYWVGCHQAVKDWVTYHTQCIADKGPIRCRGQLQHYIEDNCNIIAMASDRLRSWYDRAANTEVSMKESWYYSTTQRGREDYPTSYKPVGMDRIK